MSSHNEFSYFVEICENIRSTNSKNAKVSILSEYLAGLNEDSLPIAVLFLSGRIFPRGSKLNVNVGFSTIMQSLSEIAMLDAGEIQQIYLAHGDIGALSEYAVSKKHMISLFQQQQLTLSFVYNQLKKIADTVGPGAGKNKTKILTGLLINILPLEAKYLIKIINGEMRIGLVEGLVEIAIAKAFNQNIQVIREAMLVVGDIAQVSILAKRNSLDKAIIKPLTPLSFMLADVMFTAEEIIKYFQEPQKRLRKKTVTEQIMAEIPVIYTIYDIMYFNGENIIKKTLKERKEILSSIVFKQPIINSSYKIVSSEQEIISVFDKSRDIGHEGLVLKEPYSQYHPGKRGRYWVKLKKELDTIDAVIVMAEYGHGKRAGTLSDYTFAVRDWNNNNNLRTIGKAYSGLTDEEIDEMTSKLKSLMVKDDGYKITVKPEIVLEIAFDSIQKSDRHDSGFALRFPRIKNIRDDKTVADIDTLEKDKQIYERQVYLMDKRNDVCKD